MDLACGSARDRLGRTLGGEYLLEQVLGAGGTAVVYRAKGAAGQPVALKVLHDHLSRNDEVCARFLREGKLGNVLNHPGTVRVLDQGMTDEGSPYLVLELLEGESLEERRIRAGGKLELAETIALVDDLLAVLEIAHGKNIVHRDIKPSNLFITKSGHVKVLDFGIARLTDDTSSATSTKTGQTVGTPAFMPPEQALSRPRDVDARTDVWSVGATMFTLLSGEHVHLAESSSEHLVKAATMRARSLAKALPGVPANVEAFVARALAFDKADRWASAATMRAELKAVRLDPGPSIGTTAFPAPERNSSDESVPAVAESIQTVRRVRDESYGDRTSDAAMSVTSNPGIRVFRSRRGWVLPFALSTALLVSMSALVITYATRTAPTVVAAAPREERPVVEPPPPAIVLPAVTTTPVVTAQPSAATTTPAPKPTTRAGAPRSPSSGAGTPKKPAGAASSKKDVYRPF